MEDNQIQKVQFRCVYKTGGPYSPVYVERLRKAILWSASFPSSFLCLTDDPHLDCETIPLKHGWSGWWSKIELFRPDLPKIPSIYFDLDTIITGNIDRLSEIVKFFDFVALKGFNQRFAKPGNTNFASGVMLGSFWKYSNIYTEFLQDPVKYMQQPREKWMHGDQGFIADNMDIESITRLQELCPVNYVVGKKLLNKLSKIPAETCIVAWSGEPRLHTFAKEGRKSSLLAELDIHWKGAF